MAILLVVLHNVPLEVRYFALHMLYGLIVDIVCVALLKVIAKRPRPSYGNLKGFNLVNPIDKFSFPSGHSSR